MAKGNQLLGGATQHGNEERQDRRERVREREKDGKVVVYLPNMEADRVHNSRLDDLHTWKHSPGDCYRLVGVTVCQVLRSLRGKEQEEREKERF